MDSLISLSAVAAATGIMYLRKQGKAKKYTCHEDGSTDCPCYQQELWGVPVTPKQLSSIKVTLKPGDKLWLCTCGASKNFPYCDGSHRAVNAAKGTSFTPKPVSTEKAEGEDLWLCACGHSKSRPFCDGSHKKVKLSKA